MTVEVADGVPSAAANLPNVRRRLLVTVLVATPLLAACGSEAPPPAPAAPPPASAPARASAPAIPPPSPAGDAATAADGDDLAACVDGDCEVTVRSGTAIRVAPELGIDRVVIDDVGDRRARITIEPSDGGTVTASGSGPRSSYGDLTVRVERVVGDSAVVSLVTS